MLLEGAINALGKVGLMLNVEKSDLRRGAGRAARAEEARPFRTLSDERLAGREHDLEESTVRTIIPRLKEAGAQGIVEYPLNKIVMYMIRGFSII